MKKIAIILTFVITLSVSTTTFAHPGRLDGAGGHTCWTNCSKWGYEYGSYHYHQERVKKAKN